MKPQCTWQDPPDKRCTLDGNHDHKDNLGVVWASLCDAHHEKLERDTNPENLDIKACLSSWVRASGGAKRMAERMV